MAVKQQHITDHYALYNGDCVEVLQDFPDESIDLSIYSPPFAGLYNYSSSDNDMSNCKTYEEFMQHYEFLISIIGRITKAGRMTVVHCQDVPTKGDRLIDFPGDIIRAHERNGFVYHDRHMVWKEPLKVAIRTRSKGLMHRQIVKDSTLCRTALADYILVFRKKGENKVPVEHPLGITKYWGSNPPPEEVRLKYKDHKDPSTNKWAHYIWQKYASAFWDDIRINNVLEYKKARDKDDEKHCHPLQLDVIARCVELWSNPNEVVLTPFMGVGSEVYGAVVSGRRGIGVELKESYYRQSIRNLKDAEKIATEEDPQAGLFDIPDDETEFEEAEVEL